MKNLRELNLPRSRPGPSNQQGATSNKVRRRALDRHPCKVRVREPPSHTELPYPCPACILKSTWNDLIRGNLVRHQKAWVVWLCCSLAV